MSILNLYVLNTAEQLHLFYSENGVLELSKVMESMIERRAPINDDGSIGGEGFISPVLQYRNQREDMEEVSLMIIRERE